MKRTTSLLLLSILVKSISAEVFQWRPKSIDTIVGMPVTFECGRSTGGYGYFFTYTFPPGGASLSIMNSSSEHQADGGIKVKVSFVATAELNNTGVICHAVGPTTEMTETAFVRVQHTPEISPSDIRVCQIAQGAVFQWPSAFTLPGIKVHYKFFGSGLIEEHITTDTNFSIKCNSTQTQYVGKVAVVLIAAAANQTATGRWTHFTHQLQGDKTLSVTQETLPFKRNNTVDFYFIVKLPFDAISNCSFENDDMKNPKLISCNHSGGACEEFDASIEYENGQLKCNSTLHLLNQKYESKVCFNYSGQHIVTSDIITSTHDIQNVSITSNNCLEVSLINGSSISMIHLKLQSSHKSFEIDVPISSLCPIVQQNFNLSREFGNWTLRAYDSSRAEPAIELKNITVLFPEEIATTVPSAVPSSGSIIVVKEAVHLGLVFYFLLMMLILYI